MGFGRVSPTRTADKSRNTASQFQIQKGTIQLQQGSFCIRVFVSLEPGMKNKYLHSSERIAHEGRKLIITVGCRNERGN